METNTKYTGNVQTILGMISADSLGITLTHEHLLIDMSVYFLEPTEAGEKKRSYEPVTLENLGLCRADRTKNVDNLQITDESIAVKEALLYKMAGGKTIVEVSNIGIGRDPLGLARISRLTGLNIIMGSGYYIGPSTSQEVNQMSVEEIADQIIREITIGIGDTGLRAGIIGEIGCSLPLEDGEIKVLRAGVLAQRKTGAPLTIHPSFSDELVLEIVDIVKDAGGDLSHTIICHNDLFGFNLETRLKIAKRGCYLEYDNFGHTGYPHLYQGKYLNLVSDLERLRGISELINEGFIEQILISHDICLKDCLSAYGGYGYAHIINNLLPIMRTRGFTDDQINTILVENPKRVLQFFSTEE
jgi:phosphotriesterase-related protein